MRIAEPGARCAQQWTSSCGRPWIDVDDYGSARFRLRQVGHDLGDGFVLRVAQDRGTAGEEAATSLIPACSFSQVAPANCLP
jgi:hypothetical protein